MLPKIRFWSGSKMLYMDGYQQVNAILECLKQQMLFDNHHIRDVRSCDHVGDYGAAFMLSTGLTDANGREIYQGDICRFTTMIAKLNGVGVVNWSKQGGYWQGETKLPFLLHTAVMVEVIGNIYENPELMEESNELE